MNQYEKISKDIRKKVSKVTLSQQKEILSIYEDVIKELSSKAKKSRNKSLSQRWILDYKKQIKSTSKELNVNIKNQITSSIYKGSELGIQSQQLIFKEIFRLANIDPGNHFNTMFSKVNDNVVRDIISGKLYKDNKTLSSRIWKYSNEFQKDIQYTINKAILEKKSAIELAKDLEGFILDPAKRDSTWGTCYPKLKNKKVEYNAMRLARTSINHAYQNSTIQSSNMNPYVEGIEWQSALIHGRTCELCKERHGKVFPKDDVPLDHPNGLCTMIPFIPKSLEEVATELSSWLDGGDNHVLDSWYIEYGDYFAFKKL